MRIIQKGKIKPHGHSTLRRGVIMVLGVFIMIPVLAFASFAVDLGFVYVVRSQMQGAADAAALAAAYELAAGMGSGASSTSTTVMTKAGTAATNAASLNRTLDRASVYVDGTRDLKFGKRVWNSTSHTWTYQWNVAPYDCVQVKVQRNVVNTTTGMSQGPDGAINLSFARVLGHKTMKTTATATAAMKTGMGFRIAAGSPGTADALPIACDKPTWDALMAGTGSDNYTWNESTKTVTSGPDGIKEINIYPNSTTNLPSGNRGTVDLGSPNNSTADLSRQIRYGLNAYDLSFFANNTISFENGPLPIQGDTGISAGIKDDLIAVIGRPKAMPIFTSVTGPGNNAVYTCIKFVGVRIMYVKLTGSPSQKMVVVQPAPFVSRVVVPSSTQSSVGDNFYSSPKLTF